MNRRIKAVFFDFGGTLYDYQTTASAALESQMEALSWAGVTIRASEVQSAYRKTMSRIFHHYLPRPFYLHKDLFRDALAGLFEACGARLRPEYYERFRDVLMKRFERDLHLRDDAIETLQGLKQLELCLGIVSNIDEDQLVALTNMVRVSTHFDFLLSSERARSCKPDPGIFEHALRLAGCRPEQALFVGDSMPQDVAGANRAGLRSVLLWHREDRDPPEQGPTPMYRIRQLKGIFDILKGVK